MNTLQKLFALKPKPLNGDPRKVHVSSGRQRHSENPEPPNARAANPFTARIEIKIRRDF